MRVYTASEWRRLPDPDGRSPAGIWAHRDGWVICGHCEWSAGKRVVCWLLYDPDGGICPEQEPTRFGAMATAEENNMAEYWFQRRRETKATAR